MLIRLPPDIVIAELAYWLAVRGLELRPPGPDGVSEVRHDPVMAELRARLIRRLRPSAQVIPFPVAPKAQEELAE